jgi:hypothetical protein
MSGDPWEWEPEALELPFVDGGPPRREPVRRDDLDDYEGPGRNDRDHDDPPSERPSRVIIIDLV